MARWTTRGRAHVARAEEASGASSSSLPPVLDDADGGGRVTRHSREAYLRRRVVVFVLATVGYAVYYITRVSINFVAPAMLASSALAGIDIASIGAITTVFPICYGCSKLVSGVVGDRYARA